MPRLAVAGDAASVTAANYLKHHYLPLVNAALNSNVGFGNNLVDLVRLSRLQVFATHVWAANHGDPGRRIGFAWAPMNSTPEQETQITAAIAGAVSRSYPKNEFNLGK